MNSIVETEIKLRASRETLHALRSHPLLAQNDGWRRSELGNQYYDTANRDLARARVALRVRRDGEQFIQTLKSRGRSVAGFSERDEWNWPVPGAALDISKLTDDCWPAALTGLPRADLRPVFSTDFVREKTEISHGTGESQIRVEAALDLGQVIAGECQEEICELELELHQGQPVALLQFACELAKQLPLIPCDISKAERGYRLLDRDSYQVRLGAPHLSAELCLDEAFAELAWHLLGSCQRLAEQYRFNGNWKLIHHWLQYLQELRALLASPGQAVPRASSSQLRQTLDELLADWQPLLAAGEQDQDARQLANARLAEEFQRTRWGHWSLQLAGWLLGKGWTQTRNAHGQQLGQLPLGRWLTQQLRAECQKLALPRWHDDPAGLADQLPRLQRVLVWLHFARNLLDIVDADQLYGELGKLAALLRQPDDPQSPHRSMLGQQVNRTTSLTAWKVLAN